jgi:hypothetical protein
VNIALYCERPPIPKQTTHEITSDGALSEIENLREVRDAVAVREIEVSAMMDLTIAEQLRDLLTATIDEWNSIAETNTNAAGETPPTTS